MKKIILWIFVLLVVGLLGAYLARNLIVAGAITKGSTYATGTDTHLGSASLSFTAGSLELNDFKIDNPDGFESDQFLSIESGILDVNSGSVFADVVEVDSLILGNIKVILEHNDGKSNYKTLMANIEKLDLGASESTVTLRIKKIAIKGIRVEVKAILPGNNRIDEALEINDIELKDVGGNEGASIAQVTSEVVQVIVDKAVAEGKKKLSGDVGKYLEDSGKGALEEVGSDAIDKVKDLFGGDKK